MRGNRAFEKKDTMLIRFLTVLCLAVVILTTRSALADERPNIVFLMSDDQCTYSMGCYGTPGALTPHLDQLAADGMVFDRHYDTTAICMASRVNVMTGLFEYKAACNFDTGPLLREHWEQTYPMLLRKSGYETAFAGKFGFVVAEKPDAKGRLPEEDFDMWGGGPGQTSYVTAKNASMAKYVGAYPHSTLSYGAFGRDFIATAAENDKPFCLSISFKAPHHPVAPDPKFDDVYADAKFTKPINFGREYGLHFSKQSQQGRQFERFHSWNYSSDYDGVMAKYYQQIYAIDVAVGMIRDALTEHNVADDTVVIYTSDNGFMCGSHGYGSKVIPYEESTRVPLIMYLPGHSNSGRELRCGALTGNVDFAPTILELAGIAVPEHLDGRSLLALYADPGREIHQSLPLINVWGPKEVHSLAVVTKDRKYIYWPYAGQGFKATEEMYDLRNDPHELTSAAERSSSALTEMRAVYDATVADWQTNGAKYHGYDRFGKLVDRHLTWEEKTSAVAD